MDLEIPLLKPRTVNRQSSNWRVLGRTWKAAEESLPRSFYTLVVYKKSLGGVGEATTADFPKVSWMVECMGGEQFVTNNSERPKLACNLFIFNKVNSRLSLERYLLPYIPGCSRDRTAQPPTEPPGCCDYKPCCWRTWGQGGRVIKNLVVHMDIIHHVWL